MQGNLTTTCALCGRVRPTNKRPQYKGAAKICRSCNLENNRRHMARMMRRNYLPTLPTREKDR